MNKWIGVTLVTVGFIVAALVAVLDAHQTQWTYYGLSLGAGIAGVLLLRWHAHQLKSCQHAQADNMQCLTDAMEQVVGGLGTLTAQDLSDQQCLVMHRTIDQEFAGCLRDFAEARETISHRHGLQVYAEVMSCFATGERYLNRVWSASADGYVDEVTSYLPQAQDQFSECLDKLRALAT